MRQVYPRLRYELRLFLCKIHKVRRRLRYQACTVASVLAAKNWLCYSTSIMKMHWKCWRQKTVKSVVFLDLYSHATVKLCISHVERQNMRKKTCYFSTCACRFCRMACRWATQGAPRPIDETTAHNKNSKKIFFLANLLILVKDWDLAPSKASPCHDAPVTKYAKCIQDWDMKCGCSCAGS